MISTIFVIIGSLWCLLLTAQLLATLLGQWRTATLRRMHGQAYEAQVAAKTAALQHRALLEAAERPAWRGWKRMVVAEIADEAADCRSIYLRLPDDAPLPPFRPGQFITIGRPEESNGGTIVSRCYSLSDAPDPRYWRITIRRVPGGRLSPVLCGGLAVGDPLLVRAPSGRFSPAWDDDRPLTLVAAGVGITPIVAIIRHCLIWQPSRPLRLFYQARDPQHAPFLEALRGWAAEAPALQMLVSFSRPATDDRCDHTGRLDARLLLRNGAAAEGEFLICGPPEFLKTIRGGLVQQGISADAIISESFGGGSVQQKEADAVAEQREGRRQAAPAGAALVAAVAGDDRISDVSIDVGAGRQPVDDDSDEPGIVQFSQSLCSIRWSEDCRSLLEAAERAGVVIDSGCREGQCGACLVRVLSGQVQHQVEPIGPLEPDEALACIARPIGPVRLDA